MSDFLTDASVFLGPGWHAAQHAGMGLFSYTGLVATRCGIPTSLTAGSTQAMSRTKHIATERITWLQVAFANFYAVLNGGEANPGAAATYTASIEYPAGTIAGVFRFGGSVSGVAADGATLLSDVLTGLNIPMGAAFYVRAWHSRSTGILYNGNYGLNNVNGSVPLSGEWNVFGNSISDLTQSTTNSNNQQAGVVFKPALLIGAATRPTFYIAGDSRCGNGTNYDNSANAYGAVGEIERWLIKSFASFNAGNPGEKLFQAQGGSAAKRIALAAQYCSHLIIQYGINDFAAGYNSTNMQSWVYAYAALHGNKPTYACTVGPKTTSTDSFATTVNQTIDAMSNTNRVAYNNAVRGGLAWPVAGYIEVADTEESARNSGLWAVTGSANGYTSDGLHGNNAMMRLLEGSNQINQLGLLFHS